MFLCSGAVGNAIGEKRLWRLRIFMKRIKLSLHCLMSEVRRLWRPLEVFFHYSSFKPDPGTPTMVCGVLGSLGHHGMTSGPFFWYLRLSLFDVLSWTLQQVERVLTPRWARTSPVRHNQKLAPFHIAPFFNLPSAFLLFVTSVFPNLFFLLSPSPHLLPQARHLFDFSQLHSDLGNL